MQTSVQIMGIDVDILSNDVFASKMNGYLTTENIQVIFFASAEVLERASKEAEYRKLVDMAELFLPGEEESLFSEYHVEALNAGDIVVSCKSFGLVLENLQKEDRSMYIVSDTQENVDMLKEYCVTMQPELKIVGSSVYQEDMDGAAIVNEINTHIPDFLLVNLPVGEQESWIMKHVSQLNAKLCVAIGGVADHIIHSNGQVPGWIHKLHLDKLYWKWKRK